MPCAPARPCPKCPNVLPCPVHSRDRTRGTATERGYGAKWRKLRIQVLIEEPVCRECLLAHELEREGPAIAIRRVALLIDQTEAQVKSTFASMVERGETRKRFIMQPTSQIDHIKPKNMGGTDDRRNLQGLCAQCHSCKTARESSGWGGSDL